MAFHCQRCGADLDPPPPEPEPEPEPVLVYVAPPPPPAPSPKWPLWVAVFGGLAVWIGYLLLIA